MAATIEYDSVRVPGKLKARRALALPLYGIALTLSFLMMPSEVLLRRPPVTASPHTIPSPLVRVRTGRVLRSHGHPFCFGATQERARDRSPALAC
jgi:hypothetical protein